MNCADAFVLLYVALYNSKWEIAKQSKQRLHPITLNLYINT